jgi:hypothetical protein
MTKQQTIELLQKQMPSFYSLEQVIKLISDIEDSPAGLTRTQMKNLCDRIKSRIEDNLDQMDFSSIIDRGTAEFSLKGNEIELEGVEVDSREVADEAVYGIAEEIEDYFETEFAEQETLEIPNS